MQCKAGLTCYKEDRKPDRRLPPALIQGPECCDFMPSELPPSLVSWAPWCPCSVPAVDHSLDCQLSLQMLLNYSKTILSLTTSRHRQQHRRSTNFQPISPLCPTSKLPAYCSSNFVMVSLLFRHLVGHLASQGLELWSGARHWLVSL